MDTDRIVKAAFCCKQNGCAESFYFFASTSTYILQPAVGNYVLTPARFLKIRQIHIYFSKNPSPGLKCTKSVGSVIIIDSFLILLPLIFLALGGYFLSDVYSLSEDTLIRIVTDFFMPVLIFYSLSKQQKFHVKY